VSDSPANVNTLWGRVLVDELARAGLRHVAIAPGSRSTPLVTAFAGHPDVRDHSLIDERAAAFFALGLARATGEPAAVLTTSGTAAANLLPAVLEADRSGVPLLLLTADRPPELRDAGESQSADQVKLFGERVRWFHLVAEPAAGDELLRYLRSTACEAWARASGAGGPPGPVHLDLPFRKPLAPLPAAAGEGALPAGFDPAGPGAAGRPGGAPWRRVALGRRAPDPAAVEELALALAGAERPLVLAGALNLTELGADLGAEPEAEEHENQRGHRRRHHRLCALLGRHAGIVRAVDETEGGDEREPDGHQGDGAPHPGHVVQVSEDRVHLSTESHASAGPPRSILPEAARSSWVSVVPD